MRVGQMVRLVFVRSGSLQKADDGRIVTIRAIDHRGIHPGMDIRVDDGNPSDPDLSTNGFRRAMWVRRDEIQSLEDDQ